MHEQQLPHGPRGLPLGAGHPGLAGLPGLPPSVAGGLLTFGALAGAPPGLGGPQGAGALGSLGGLHPLLKAAEMGGASSGGSGGGPPSTSTSSSGGSREREQQRERERERERMEQREQRDREREEPHKGGGASSSADERHRVAASPASERDKHSRTRSPFADLEAKRRKEERAQESDGDKSDQDLVVDVANEDPTSPVANGEHRDIRENGDRGLHSGTSNSCKFFYHFFLSPYQRLWSLIHSDNKKIKFSFSHKKQNKNKPTTKRGKKQLLCFYNQAVQLV